MAFAAADAFLVWAGVSRRRRSFRPASMYVRAWGLFAAALLSKSAVAPRPFALLVLVWWRRGRIVRRDLAGAAGLVALAIPAGLITAWIETHYVAVQSGASAVGLVERVLVAGRAMCFYAGKIFWPANLVFVYPRWTVDPHSVRAWLYPAAVVLSVLVLGLARRRIGRGPVAAAGCFLIMLSPALSFFDVYFMLYSWVQDHFQYFAAPSLLALAAATLDRGIARLASARALPIARASVAAGLVIVLMALSSQRLPAFHDAESLWRDTLSGNPTAWIAHNNLGALLRERGRTREALEEFRSAVDARPPVGGVYFNLGLTLDELGRHAEAVDAYRAAIPTGGKMLDARLNLSLLLYQTGDAEGAWRELQEYTRLGGIADPAFTDAVRSRLGRAQRPP